jgi:hypothetical protein
VHLEECPAHGGIVVCVDVHGAAGSEQAGVYRVIVLAV